MRWTLLLTLQRYANGSMLPHCNARSLLHRQLRWSRRVNALFLVVSQRSKMQHTKKFIEVSRLSCELCVWKRNSRKRANKIFFSALSFHFHLCSIGRKSNFLFSAHPYDEWLLSTIIFWWRKNCTLMAFILNCVIFIILRFIELKFVIFHIHMSFKVKHVFKILLMLSFRDFKKFF